MATFRKRGPYQWEAQIRERGVWLSRGEAESTTLREALERYQAEIVPHKKGKVQKDFIIKMLLTLPLALRSLASILSADC